MIKLSNIKSLIQDNKKVLENYSFMTVLQVLNVAFGLLIYPYVISHLGAETYGIYAFVFSSSVIFGAVISFSFDLLATKEVAENINDIDKKSEIVSSVVFGRIFMFILCFGVLLLLSVFLRFISEYLLVYIVTYLGCLSSVLFHPWYFQAIQKMRIVTYIQVGFKLLSLPFIFLLIKNSSDLLLYTTIITTSSLLGALFGFLYLLFVEKIKLIWGGIPLIKRRFKVSLPIFYTSVLGMIKSESIPQVLGMFFGMYEVALYDLAKKVIKIPIALTMDLNNAFFPKFAQNNNPQKINNLLKYEYIFGVFWILVIAVLGQWAVKVLGQGMLSEAYYIALILSVNVLTYLVLGVYLYLVFVLNDRNELLWKNQLVAFFSFLILAIIGLLFYRNIYIFAFALSLSGIAEVIFCRWHFKKIR